MNDKLDVIYKKLRCHVIYQCFYGSDWSQLKARNSDLIAKGKRWHTALRGLGCILWFQDHRKCGRGGRNVKVCMSYNLETVRSRQSTFSGLATKSIRICHTQTGIARAQVLSQDHYGTSYNVNCDKKWRWKALRVVTVYSISRSSVPVGVIRWCEYFIYWV